MAKHVIGQGLSALARFVAALLVVGAEARAEPARVALVVGNATYAMPGLPALPGCVASARAVGGALRALGYDVTERLDAGRGQTDAALAAFARRLRDGRDDGVIAVAYVCGHVLTSGGRPFLLPVSANLARESDVLSQGILARALVDAPVRAEVRAGLVVLDLVAAPGGEPVGFDVLAGAASARVAVVASAAEATSDRVTPLADALRAGLAGPSVPAERLVGGLRARITGGRAAGMVPTDADFGTAPTPAVAPEARGTASVPRPTEPEAAAPRPAAPATEAPARPAMPDPPALTSTEEGRMTEADRRRVQAALATIGYYSGRVDGVFGAETRAAIRRYQFERGEERTGTLSAAQAAGLFIRR